MKARLVIVFLLIVLIPLGFMAWLGVRVARSERVALQDSFRKLHMDKLRDVERMILRVVKQRERALLGLSVEAGLDAGSLRVLIRRMPAVGQVFLLAGDGELIHPAIEEKLSQSEEAFLTRAQQVWRDKAVFVHAGSESSLREHTDHGWYSWYWGNGIQILLWRRTAGGQVVGFELNRSRLIADIIAELPDSTLEAPGLPVGRIVLKDSKGDTLYQWGDDDPAVDDQPLVRLSLGEPLSPWRLDYHVPPELEGVSGSGALYQLLSALGAVALALLGLAVYFYRDSTRELREARQRVSFVNHVSHELKTPLTNIRMYAELLRESADEQDEKTVRHLDVVVSESERLSRLISNVLTFGRQQRRTLKLRKSEHVVDSIIATVLKSFAPSLQAQGVRVRFEAGAPQRVRVDADAVGQILSNLLSNVEKYAPDSGEVEVRSGQDAETISITVIDNGPGIPPSERGRIFLPFVRLSSQLTDGVAGTGIGLSIARELARLHGGDLRLQPSERGAAFRLTLEAKSVPSNHSEA